MTEMAVYESVTIAGRPERVAVARAFASALLGQDPKAETAVLLLSELVANSVRHSGSALPGQTVTIAVLRDDRVIRMLVTDGGGTTGPALRRRHLDAEGGRGLLLVDCLAARWGVDQTPGRTTTWFEL